MSAGDNILSKTKRVLKWICNILLYQCLSILAFFIIRIPIYENNPDFWWHVILSTLGIIPLMSQTIILFSNNTIWSLQTLEKYNYWIHGIAISIASCVVITGIVFEAHREIDYNETKYFKSAHSVTGLISGTLIICALVSYPFVFIGTKFCKTKPSAYFELIHDLLAQSAYIMGILSLCTGYNTEWFKFYTPRGIPITFTFITILGAIWSLKSSWKSLYHKIKFSSFRKNTEQEMLVI